MSPQGRPVAGERGGPRPRDDVLVAVEPDRCAGRHGPMLDLHEPVGRTWNEEQDGCGRLGAHAGLELGLCLALFEPGFSGRKHQLSGLERPLLPFDRRPLILVADPSTIHEVPRVSL